MAEHLTALELDEAAATLPLPEPARVHLSSCADCTARLEALGRRNQATLAMPESKRRLQTLLQRAAVAAPQPIAAPVELRPRRRWLVAMAAAAVPLAAGLLLLLSHPLDDTRLKGAATVELLAANGAVTTKAHVGDRVSLALGGGGLSHAAVFEVNQAGEVSLLFPVEKDQTAPLPRGARVSVASFDVTPGSIVLHAFYTDGAAPLGPLKTALEAALRQSQGPLDALTPPVAPKVAHVRLEVE